MITHPTYDQIHQACVLFVNQLNQRQIKIDLIVAVARGGLIPGVILSHMLGVEMIPLQYSSAKGKGDDKKSSTALSRIPIQFFNKYGMSILVVDDICDSGHTLHDIFEHYQSSVTHKFYSAVLYFKQQDPQLHVPDLVWQTIPNDAPWIIFPFEKQGD